MDNDPGGSYHKRKFYKGLFVMPFALLVTAKAYFF